jgi:hypothetical protein
MTELTEQDIERAKEIAESAQKTAEASNNAEDWEYAAKLWLLAGDTQRYNHCLRKAEAAG